MSNISKRGITLVELVVVIAVIGVLVAITLPAVQSAREAGRRAQCTNRLRQIGLGMQSYHATFEHFPPGCADGVGHRPHLGKRLSWNVFLLPYIEHEPLWRQADLDAAFNAKANHPVGRTVMPAFLCPSTVRAPNRPGDTTGDVNGNGQWDPGDDLAFTDYGGIEGVSPLGPDLGVMRYRKPTRVAHIIDGLSNTMMIGEISGRGGMHSGQWMNGHNIFDVGTAGALVNDNQTNELWSDHKGGVNSLFCDASVHFIYETIAAETLFALCTRARRDLIEGGGFD